MRSIFQIFLFIFCVEKIQAGGNVEILHSHCNSSGTTINNVVCDLKSHNGKAEINIAFDVLKKIKKVYLTIYILSKNKDKQWTVMMKYVKVDICRAMNIGEKFPVVHKVIEGYKESFKTLPHSCPVNPGHFEVKEANSDALDKSTAEANNQIFKIHMKGNFKFFIVAFTDDDPNAFTISWETEIKD